MFYVLASWGRPIYFPDKPAEILEAVPESEAAAECGQTQTMCSAGLCTGLGGPDCFMGDNIFLIVAY